MRSKLTIFCGNAGTGKTTLGKRLAAESGALFLDIDTVSERLVQAGLAQSGKDPNDRDSPEYKAAYRSAIHDTLFAIADENLSHLPCVIVAPFTQGTARSNIPSRRRGAPLLCGRDPIRLVQRSGATAAHRSARKSPRRSQARLLGLVL